MKKNITLLALWALVGIGAQAQQINGSFDKQTPWKEDATRRTGTTVAGWDVLNVTQMGSFNYALTFSDNDHTDPDGKDASKKSVRMECRFLGLGETGSNSPSYMTLGKTWVYADILGVMSGGKDDPDDSDGGSQGGIAFTARPDSIVGFFKRTHGTEKPNEPARIIVYSWKGTSTSIAPANSGSFNDMFTSTENAPRQTLTDRDIDVLGRNADKKPAAGITLVSSTDYAIEGDIPNWRRIAIPLNYLTNDTPEKLNVIISSANYWNRAEIGADNKLWADDVRLIYNAKLKSLAIGGKALPTFDEDTLSYTLPASDLDKEIKAEAWGKNASVEVKTDGNVKTITVTDESSKGQKTYVYTLTFAGEETVITTPAEAPVVTYGDEAIDLGFKSNSTAPFSYTFSDKGVLEVRGGKVVAVGVGSVNVTASQAAANGFASAVSASPLTISVKKAPLTISLADTCTVQRGQSFLKKDAAYVLKGLKLGDDTLKVSDILTTMPTVKGSAPKEAEHVGDKRDVTLSNGEATNYDITYAPDQKVTVVKNEVSVYVGYSSSRFNANYDGDNYHTIKVAAGQNNYDFSFVFTGTAYDDEARLAKLLPTDSIKCSVDKAATVDAEFPVSLNLPTLSNTEFTLKSLLPADAKVVVAKAPVITLADTSKVAYGDADFALATTKDGVSLSYKNLTDSIVKLSRGTVSILRTGEAAIQVYTAAKGDFGATSQVVKFFVHKAPLTITVANDTITSDDMVPTQFELSYAGFVKGDTVSTVFPDGSEPVAYVDVAKVTPGSYPIKVKLETMPDNYDVKVVEGTLVINVSTGIGTISGRNGANIIYANGTLQLPEATNYEVYTSAGRLITKGYGTSIRLSVNPTTIYIVKTPQHTFRLMAH